MKGYAPSSAPSRKASKGANGEGHRSFVGGACVEGEGGKRNAEDWCGEELAQYTLFHSSERSSTVCVNVTAGPEKLAERVMSRLEEVER